MAALSYRDPLRLDQGPDLDTRLTSHGTYWSTIKEDLEFLKKSRFRSQSPLICNSIISTELKFSICGTKRGTRLWYSALAHMAEGDLSSGETRVLEHLAHVVVILSVTPAHGAGL